MKKLIIIIGLILALLSLVACSDTAQLHGRQNEEGSTAAEVSQEPNTSLIPEDLKEPQIKETLTITHEKDGTIYNLQVWKDYANDTILKLFDDVGNEVQSIDVGNTFYLTTPNGIGIMDVNLDGYMDIVATVSAWTHGLYDLYIWEDSSQNFVKVIYQGFEVLGAFEVHDSYINNFIRGATPEEGVKYKLVWEGNTLIKELEY